MHPAVLARNIAAFANSQGGVIVLGIAETDATAQIVGCDPEQIENLYQAAITHLTPLPPTSIEIVDVAGKQIAIISVEKAKELVLTREGAFHRVGESTRRMSAASIASSLPHKELSANERQSVAEGIATLTGMVEALQQP